MNTWSDKSNLWFIYFSSTWVIMALLAHLFFNSEYIFFSSNIQHSIILDKVFYVLTGYGNAIYLGATCILLLLIKRSHLKPRVIHLISAFLISSVFVLLGKNVFWPEMPRPVSVFGKEGLQWVDGISLNAWKSFPSGHTTTAFALISVVATWNGRNTGFALALLAFLIGYSRIYLNQHFVLDVAVGAIIGIVSCSLGLHLTRNFLLNTKNKEDLIEEVAQI